MSAGLVGVARRARLFAALVGGLALLLPIRLATHRVRPQAPSRIDVIYFRILLWGLRIRVELDGDIAGDALIVANHISWTDILVLGATRPMTFVAKSEVRDWPLLGHLARLGGTLFIRRDARQSAPRQVAALRAALNRGPVAFFPEGTTSDGGDVLPFRPALFAGATGRPVQPVSIVYRPRGRDWAPGELGAFAWDGDKAFWPHLLALGGANPIECRMVAHHPMTSRQADRKALAHDCRAAIRSALPVRQSEDSV